MKGHQFTAHWKRGKDAVHVSIAVISFKEGDSHIFHAPALDLSGYGDTIDEARRSFEIVVSEYLEFGTRKNTLWKDLQRLGWKIHGHEWVTPSLTHLMRSNKDFARVVDTYPFQKEYKEVLIPSPAV